MAIYSIRDLEKLTGIKAHTIRIWEQRYGLITPARTDTNIRYYTDENLRHLFNIALLNRNGIKISKLAKMSPEEITAKGAAIAQNNPNPNSQIDALTLGMIDLNEGAFEQVFVEYVHLNGFERCMLELIYPFLDKLRLLWLTNSISPSHEKFVGQIIRRKLMCAVDQSTPRQDTPVFLLFSPEGESQELTLLFLQYLLRSRGMRVTYLGANVTVSDLKDACQTLRPSYVFTILQEPLPRQPIQSYVDQVSKAVSDSEILLTGQQFFVGPVNLPPNARVLNGLPGTLQFLDGIKVRR
ncbi:MAG TPA: helix-turn-helix-type transcriptional regulator [Saprospirales bacterium]|nr:helix-turn-helix-type transcriptional regulator [Saprospirales bacterium]